MRRLAGRVLLLLALTAALAACSGPLGAADPGAQGAPPSGQQARTSQVRPIVPTETAVRPAPVLSPTPAFGDAIATPLAPTVTPVTPPLPTLTLAPRQPLDAGSQAALAALQATAVVQLANATANAAALPAREVQMLDVAFTPTQLTVRPGTTVVWRNLDRVQHHVRGGEFDSGNIASGAYWASILPKPGLYQFICSFHPTMRAEITVTADDSRPIQLGS
ncbi:MAG TPA: cupredoxin domain-containing protein [Chloroflexota bacterium]|nr:cupredoxin domain-containing protein [Chloroflexota bacterium]